MEQSEIKVLKIGAVYRHYKGNLYKIKCFATHTETSENLVIYESLISPGIEWARPINVFCGTTKEGVPRFREARLECLNGEWIYLI